MEYEWRICERWIWSMAWSMAESMRAREGEKAHLFSQSGKSERIEWTPKEGLECFPTRFKLWLRQPTPDILLRLNSRCDRVAYKRCRLVLGTGIGLARLSLG